MSDHRDLRALLGSKTAIVAVESDDEPRVLEQVREAGTASFRPVFHWTLTEGLARVDLELPPKRDLSSPESVLRHIKASTTDALYVLADFHPFLDEPLHIRLLKDIALAHERTGATLVLVSHGLSLPPELQSFSASVRLSLPGPERISALVQEVAEQFARERRSRVRTSERNFQLLVKNLAGLSERDVRRMARTAIYDDGAITDEDLPQVMKAKYSLLNQGGVLGFEYDTAGFGEVGGLTRLKDWLDERSSFFLGQAPAHLDPPRGVLLLGVQGGGKSLAAKAVAGRWKVPLLRLDFGALYNKFHGETERNLRESLRTAEAMAPCVLWMDELEKGLATGDNDGGTSRRVLGTLLTWMAERRAAVFLVATSNDISQLPAELVRKGRFDEIFFVDLPDAGAREAIFRIHLKKREQQPERFDLNALVKASAGFSGAEIEQTVVAGLYAAHARKAELSSGDLLDELAATRPLSVTMRERVEALRAWAAERAVAAD